MFESLINPRKAERKPWEMIFVGAFYATLSVLLANWVFLKDPVLSKYISIFIVMFTTIFTMPFMYYTIKYEEKKEEMSLSRIKKHSRTIFSLLFLFIGFIIAFAIIFNIFPQEISAANFRAQIETYCNINFPNNSEGCIAHEISNAGVKKISGNLISKWDYVMRILSNNVYVLICILIFSFAFGAGAIFILSWNAGVIASAIGIFSKEPLLDLPFGFARYMIHGIPEIAAYFVAAIAGGILSMAIIKYEYKDERFYRDVYDSLFLIVVALIILLLAAFIEVFITPILF